MELIPASLMRLWNYWELRLTVVVSLSLQIILIFLGNRRKYITRDLVKIILWLAYLSADWVATVSLGILSRNEQDFLESYGKFHPLDPKIELSSFWAPFLLLHLGGPDTITAYSIEDNELWLRHLLGLSIQVGVAGYIFLKSWNGSLISILTIPMFVVGILKYGERVWILRSASKDHFRNSVLGPPDPGPNYDKFMEDFDCKKAEGFHVRMEELGGESQRVDSINVTDIDIPTLIDGRLPDSDILPVAHYLFKMFEPLFADLILSFQNGKKSRSIIQKASSENAFRIIEAELGFVFDVLYTKAPVLYTPLGCLLRLITLSFTVSTSLVFLAADKHRYSNADVVITYLLLAAAICLEFYAVIVLISSDWAIVWVTKHKIRVPTFIRRVPLLLSPIINKRWSYSMAQYDLLCYSLQRKPTILPGIRYLFRFCKALENYHYTSFVNVPGELKDSILHQLKNKSEKGTTDYRDFKHFCMPLVQSCIPDEMKDKFKKIHWSLGVEFDRTILVWHICTDLCYYEEEQSGNSNSQRQMCKFVSDYMLYLLVMRPFMLPNGIGLIRFRDTCEEAKEFFSYRRSIKNESQACKMLLNVNTEVSPIEVKGERSKSVLFDAVILSKCLSFLEAEKWKFVSTMWVEILCYAASQCSWTYHAMQLGRGGELLTHVWLLMAHFGTTNQFQIPDGHPRIKLIVE
ncbi:PREDICTED: uncharacterized protein LOC104596790 [Nelumbo nucifera]|uniref:Uncharacterized protein LOC104596790 n=1 Tax=Nelumbo nucifera TaxID=4432 RepID=A0A1U7ZSA5_NELNU|nr:PREDICTED: uncharacterized protein LOC104596790 [Nelumbo nucifera]